MSECNYTSNLSKYNSHISSAEEIKKAKERIIQSKIAKSKMLLASAEKELTEEEFKELLKDTKLSPPNPKLGAGDVLRYKTFKTIQNEIANENNPVMQLAIKTGNINALLSIACVAAYNVGISNKGICL